MTLAVVAVFALAVPGGAAAVPAPAGCTLEATNGMPDLATDGTDDGTVQRTVGGRSYRLHVPEGLAGPRLPLLVSLHGLGGNARAHEKDVTRWSEFADRRAGGERELIVAYPESDLVRPGLGVVSWRAYSPHSADLAFLEDVVVDISRDWCVDPDRVHTTGFSAGGLMSQRAACSAADTFASAASHAGGSPELPALGRCDPPRPISVALTVGDSDLLSRPSFPDNVRGWRNRNDCGSNPTATDDDAYGVSQLYACADGTAVLSRTLDGVQHEWPSREAARRDLHDAIWAFLSDHPQP